MSDKKRSAKRKWKNALIAAALTASVILTLPGWSAGPAEAQVPAASKELVLTEGKIANSKLTITRAGKDPGRQGAITVDLYKVADAVKEPNYDGYTLAVPAGNTFTSVGNLVSSANGMRDADLTDDERKTYYNTYLNLAEAVATEVLASNGSSVSGNSVSSNDVAGKNMLIASEDITGSGSIAFDQELEAGLYLVIAHGRDLTPAEYVGKTAENKLVTMAYNNGYAYSYKPVLIALPMRGTNTANVFSTAQNAGDWQYTVNAELKAEEEIAKVPLQINKTFTNTANALLNGKNGCVFKIEATLNGQKVYSNVVTAELVNGQAVFNEDVRIPAGATVTVTEEYDGAAFRGENGDNKPVTKTANSIVENGNVVRYEVSFVNTYDNSNIGGDIVTNSFTKKDDGSYGWKNDVSSNDVSSNDVSANNG